MEGYKLLKMFRDEQKKRGNNGCMCEECIEDMTNALNNLFKT